MNHFSRYFWTFIALLLSSQLTVYAQNIRPLLDRVDAIVADSLVLPVTVENPKAVGSNIKVRLDDGRSVDASLHYVWSSSLPNTDGWTRSTPIWNTLTPSQFAKSPPTAPGTWMMMLDLPIDAVGQGIWIQEVRYEPNWLPSPMRVMLESTASDGDRFWEPALSSKDLESQYIQEAVANLRADPFQRWRAWVLTEGFSPARLSGTSPAQTDRDLSAIHTELVQSDSSQILDQIAQHFASRWQIILGRIWLIDHQVAMRLKDQLSRTAITQGQTQTTAVPMWSDDTGQIGSLAHDLLSPFVNDELRVERVVAWLDAQPELLTWIIDDAGYATTNPMQLAPSIGLLWLNSKADDRSSTLVRLRAQGNTPEVETITMGQLSETSVYASTESIPRYAQVNQPLPIDVQITGERTSLQALSDITAATPPGVIVGPLLNDWTLTAFNAQRSGQGALPPASRRVGGLLHRRAAIDSVDPREGWILYLESVIDSSSHDDSAINVWVGPRGSTRASWTVSKTLGLVEMRTDPDITVNTDYESVIQDQRWTLVFEIPPAAIGDDGLLFIAVTRTDGQSRTSWPRRMMPWQPEPGRYVVDITQWDDGAGNP